MENTTMTRTGVSAWAPVGVCTVAPIAQVQGSGLPFAGYAAAVSTPVVMNDATGLQTAKDRHSVPDPRGRHR